MFRQRSIFPGSCPPSIFDAKELNYITNYDEDLDGSDYKFYVGPNGDEYGQLTAVKNFLASKNMPYVNISAAVLHGNISVTEKDLPPEYFFTYTINGTEKKGLLDYLPIYNRQFPNPNGESFSILYPAKDTKLDSWSGPNELIAENSDMSIVLNARFSDEYKISQINDAIDYFKKKIDDYYDGVKGIKNVDAKTAIVHTTVTNDRDIWMFVIFNKDNAAVLGDFTYPVAKHAEGEALLSQIMSSVKFK